MEVGTDESVGRRGESLDGHVVGERHPAGVDFEDFAAAPLVGRADFDFAVEATAAPERRVDGVHAVRRADDDDFLAGLQSVHQREHLCDESVLHVALFVALPAEAVHLVEEDDGGGVFVRLVEYLAEALLAFALVLAHHFRTGDGDEVGVHLVRYRLGDERLPGAGRAVEQDAFRRVDAQPAEEFGVREREFDHLADAAEFLV